MTSTRYISMWSGPRNISTALMYSFAQRNDTKVLDEPLYGYYLARSGADHPGKEEIIKDMECEADRVFDEIFVQEDTPIVFLKNMAHHLYELSPNILDHFQNILLVREPAAVINSLSKVIENPTLYDTGFPKLLEVTDHILSQGQEPVVINSDELLTDPLNYLQALCVVLGIPFQEDMLHWPKGPKAEDGIWAPYWYSQVHSSTGFISKPYKPQSVEPGFQELWGECEIMYSEIKKYCINLI